MLDATADSALVLDPISSGRVVKLYRRWSGTSTIVAQLTPTSGVCPLTY